MVFSEGQYYHCDPMHRTTGIAADLVASQYFTCLEDWANHSDSCLELVGLSIHHGLNSDNKRILQTAEYTLVTEENSIKERTHQLKCSPRVTS